MIEFDDIEKSKQNINSLFKLRDEINTATPYLNDMLAKLNWYEKVYQTIPDKQNLLLKNIDTPVTLTNGISPTNFSFQELTGITGSYYSSSAETISIIKEYGSQHYGLINEYYDLSKLDELFNRILNYFSKINPNLETLDKISGKPISVYNSFDDVRKTYAEWKSGSKSNSDLAKDCRSFLDIFRGILHKARLKTYHPPLDKNPDKSWIKMSEALSRSGGGCEKQLKALQHKDDAFFQFFTKLLKKNENISVSVQEMNEQASDFVIFIDLVITLIDENLLK